MLKLLLKALCVFCTRQERRAHLKALYEKGRASRRMRRVEKKWHDLREQLLRAVASAPE